MKNPKKINCLNDYRNWKLNDVSCVLRWIFAAVSVIISVVIITSDLPMIKCLPIFAIQWLYILGETNFREFCCYRVAFEADGKLVSLLDLLRAAEEVERNLYVCDCRAIYLYEPLSTTPSKAKIINRVEISYIHKTAVIFTCYFNDTETYQNFIDLGQYHSKEAASLMKEALKEKEEY